MSAIKSGLWTEEEDALLAKYQEELGNRWTEVAKRIGTKTGQQCAQRWRHRVNPNISKEKWTIEEDRQLASLVRQYGSAWAEISRHLRGRTDQQCMGRWRRHLDPTIRRSAWTAQEDSRLQALVAQLGTSWCKISKHMEGRTAQQIRAHWCQLQQATRTAWPPTALDPGAGGPHASATLGGVDWAAAAAAAHAWPTGASEHACAGSSSDDAGSSPEYQPRPTTLRAASLASAAAVGVAAADGGPGGGRSSALLAVIEAEAASGNVPTSGDAMDRAVADAEGPWHWSRWGSAGPGPQLPVLGTSEGDGAAKSGGYKPKAQSLDPSQRDVHSLEAFGSVCMSAMHPEPGSDAFPSAVTASAGPTQTACDPASAQLPVKAWLQASTGEFALETPVDSVTRNCPAAPATTAAAALAVVKADGPPVRQPSAGVDSEPGAAAQSGAGSGGAMQHGSPSPPHGAECASNQGLSAPGLEGQRTGALQLPHGWDAGGPPFQPGNEVHPEARSSTAVIAGSDGNAPLRGAPHNAHHPEQPTTKGKPDQAATTNEPAAAPWPPPVTAVTTASNDELALLGAATPLKATTPLKMLPLEAVVSVSLASLLGTPGAGSLGSPPLLALLQSPGSAGAAVGPLASPHLQGLLTPEWTRAGRRGPGSSARRKPKDLEFVAGRASVTRRLPLDDLCDPGASPPFCDAGAASGATPHGVDFVSPAKRARTAGCSEQTPSNCAGSHQRMTGHAEPGTAAAAAQAGHHLQPDTVGRSVLADALGLRLGLESGVKPVPPAEKQRAPVTSRDVRMTLQALLERA